MCSPTSDGSAAAILASERFVEKHGLSDQAVEITGQAMVTDVPGTFESRSAISSSAAGMSKLAAQKVYDQAGIGPDDVDVIELHDCFATNELLTYEALQLCGEGEGGKLIDNDDTTYGGRWVVNPSGGLISKGHPLGATGLAQCSELTWQLRGKADKRQVEELPTNRRRPPAQHRSRRRRRRDRLPASKPLTLPGFEARSARTSTNERGTMGTIEKSATFPVSPEKLWAVVGEPDRFGDWLNMHQKWKSEVPAELKKGDVIVEVVSVMNMPNTISWTVEEYEPGKTVTLAGTGMAGVKISMTAAVSGDESSSTLDLTTSFEGQMLVGAIGAAVEKAGLADLDASLAKLTALLS